MRIIVAHTRRGTLSYLLVAFLAFVAAQTAQANHFSWIGSADATSDWATFSCWMYFNGSKVWKTPSSLPDINGYNVFFRNGVDCQPFDSSWDKVVTFSAPQKIQSGTLTVDTGTSLAAPVKFSATAMTNGLTATASPLKIGTEDATKYGAGYLQILSGTYAFKQMVLGKDDNKGCLKVGDGSSIVSFTANGDNPTLYGTSEFIADNATLDFSGRFFNMYNTSTADIKNSEMTAAILNVAVNKNNNCTTMFNGGSLTLAMDSDIGYGKTSKGYMYATNLTFTTGNANLRLGGHDSSAIGATGVVDKVGGDWAIGSGLYVGAQESAMGTFTTAGGSVTVVANAYIANGSGSTGAFAIDGGSVTVSNHAYIANGSSSTGEFAINAGSLDVARDLDVGRGSGSTGMLTINGGIVTCNNGGDCVFNVGYGQNSTGTVVLNKGDVTCKYLRLGRFSGARGCFTMNGGTLTVSKNSNSQFVIGYDGDATGEFNLNGGTVTAIGISATGSGTLTFNGGTLKANGSGTLIEDSASLAVTVGANGGTIDSGNKTITIGKAIGGTGAMRFKGGNTITLNGTNTYSGGTTVELGTTIVASTAEAKAAILDNGLVVDCRTALVADVLEASGLTASDLENVTLENCAPGSTKALDDDENPTKIVVTLAAGACVPTNSALKVFEGKTLEDIAYGTFAARMCGAAAPGFGALDSVKGYNRRLTRDGSGNLTSVVVEFQGFSSDSYVKCVVVEFTSDGTDVYAKVLGARYLQYGSLGYVFYNGGESFNGTIQAVATSYDASGYGVCDIRVASATEWTLDQDRTWSELRNGAAIDGDSPVCIKVTGSSPTLTIDENVDVAKIEFVNGLAGGVSTNSIVVSGGVAVSCGALELVENVCVSPGTFTVASATLGRGSSLLYASGVADCPAISGLGNVEIAQGATLYVDSKVDAAYVLNNGTVVKRVAETLSLPFHNGSTGVTIVSNGTLKVAGWTGRGRGHTVRVVPGATFDTNGVLDNNVSVILENGANLSNTKDDIGDTKSQTVGLTLEGDATVTAGKNFGLLAPNYEPTSLALGSHTLTLNGSKSFWLCNTTITGDGKIAVDGGTLTCIRSSSGADCALTVGANGTVRIYNSRVLTVKDFFNGGTMYADSGTLEVTGTLTAGNSLTKLTLASGAAVKVTGTNNVQTVSTAFNASGIITIDASAITAAELRNATDGRIPVLTVPSLPSGITWDVSGAPINGCRAKWVSNGNNTSTLYLCKFCGTLFIVR